MHSAKRNKQKTFVNYWAPKPSLHHREDNKRPSPAAAILQWTLPFCIVLYSVDLFDSVAERGLVPDFDDDGG